MNVSAWELEGGSWAAYAEGSINDPTSEGRYPSCQRIETSCGIFQITNKKNCHVGNY